MQALGKPDQAGFLKKQGAGSLALNKRRYFALHGSMLYYSQSPTEKPAGVIDLSVGCSVDSDPKKLTFNLSGPLLKRVFKITAENEPEFNSWLAKIKAVIDKNKNPNAPTPIKKPAGEDEQGTLYSHTQKKVSLEDFDLLTVLGRGCFGKVMKVKKKDTGEIFAMKVLSKEMVIKENMVTHTKVEKTILQNVKHPYMVQLRFAFQTPEKLYLVLDFLSGGELFFHLRKVHTFDEDRARFYAAQIILALEHLHANDIIYRDLKPENCVLDKAGHCCLTDFGLAKKIVSEKQAYTFCGTPEYLAPEILKEEGHTKAVDWWSLGIFIFEMLVGRPPFQSENINELYEYILRAPIMYPHTLSTNAISLLKGLLERDPNRRLGSGPSDATDIKSHPFFSTLDWQAMYNRQLPPPFVPQLKDGEDDHYFDPQFLREKVKDSEVRSLHPTEAAQFDNFTYVDQGYLSKN